MAWPSRLHEDDPNELPGHAAVTAVRARRRERSSDSGQGKADQLKIQSLLFRLFTTLQQIKNQPENRAKNAGQALQQAMYADKKKMEDVSTVYT